jgi:4-hydroxy-tetrahydrodipicolinate reductase
VKKIKITVVGALGRMGKILCKKIKNNPKLKLESITDKNISKVEGLQTQKNCIKAFKNSDVIIDFSNPKSTMEILKNLKGNSKIIIGTTGFTEKQETIIKNYSKKYAILKSGNMSIGINLLSFIAEQVSKK